jgi:D-sedoheptulose 7-phosphate isomerase
MMKYLNDYFLEVENIAAGIDQKSIGSMIEILEWTRQKSGRVFVLGIGGSAGNASHMTNDLRKLCHIEAYCPTDNVSELTARTNDDGFDTIFSEYLKVSKFNYMDAILILSVGGGNKEKNVSTALIKAIDYAIEKHGTVLSILGRYDGYAAENSNVSVIIPEINFSRITPHSEEFQAVVWHCIVSSPTLQTVKTKW